MHYKLLGVLMEENQSFYAYIEMVSGSDIKYVFDEKEKRLKLHRKTALPLPFPFNYGFIKGTISGDGDPLDVFIVSKRGIDLGSTIRTKPIGIIYAEDEMGIDNKIIAVDEDDSGTAGFKDIESIGKKDMERLVYILEHNKDGMEGRWTKVKGTGGRENAIAEIRKALNAVKKS